MRTDFKLDNQMVYLPNSSTLGFSKIHSKRGNWIQTADGCGRVLGRVTCEKKVYIYAFMLFGAMNGISVRWVHPSDVLSCYETPPKEILLLISGDWKHPESVINNLQPHYSLPLSLGKL